MPATPSPLRGALYSVAAFSLFAFNDSMIKFLGANYSAVQIVFFTAVAGLPFIAVYLALDTEKGPLFPVRPVWMALRMALIGTNSIVVSYTFANLPLAQCYAVFFLMPLLICILAALLLGEKIDAPRGLAVRAGLIGVLIVLRPGFISLQLGHATALLGAFLGALYFILLRHSGGGERVVVNLFYPAAAQIAVSGLLLPSLYQPMSTADLGLTGVMALSGFVGSLFILAAYRIAPTYVVAPMQYVQIVWATVFSALLFAESSDGLTVLGIIIIIASGLYIMTRPAAPTQGKVAAPG